MNNSKTNKVVTITLNPALDLTGSLNQLNVGSVSRINEHSLHAAGKGINVAKVMRELGAEVTVTGFLGRDNSDLFSQLFTSLEIQNQFIEVEGATRTNIKLVEQSGEVSDINFPSFSVAAKDIESLETKLFDLARSHDYFVLAGSLPNGVSPQLCATWIRKLRQLGKKVIFDSSDEALSQGIKECPFLIKPNIDELNDYLGSDLRETDAIREAANSISVGGVENVVVSLGELGLLWKTPQSCFVAEPPHMEIVSTVGAGDTLVAGMSWGLMQCMAEEDTLRLATALSACAVNQIGVGVPEQEALDAIKAQIQIAKIG